MTAAEGLGRWKSVWKSVWKVLYSKWNKEVKLTNYIWIKYQQYQMYWRVGNYVSLFEYVLSHHHQIKHDYCQVQTSLVLIFRTIWSYNTWWKLGPFRNVMNGQGTNPLLFQETSSGKKFPPLLKWKTDTTKT